MLYVDAVDRIGNDLYDDDDERRFVMVQCGGSAQHRYDSDTEACELFIGQLNWYINLNLWSVFVVIHRRHWVYEYMVARKTRNIMEGM